MERIRRARTDEAQEDKSRKKYTQAISASLHYRSERRDALGCKEVRWYYVGKMPIAFAQVKEPDMPTGPYVLFQRWQGNAGTSFKSEREMHDFIVSELQA